jgi:hypothetical protein
MCSTDLAVKVLDCVRENVSIPVDKDSTPGFASNISL